MGKQYPLASDYEAPPAIVTKEDLKDEILIPREFGEPFETKYGTTMPVIVERADGTPARVLIDPEGPLNDKAVLHRRARLEAFPSQEHPGQRYFLWQPPQ